MAEDKPNPLERLQVDAEELNRELLADTLDGTIGIDRDSGEAKHLGGWSDLSNKEKFVAILLSKIASRDLGYIDGSEIGIESSHAGDIIGVDDSSIRRYAGELHFVDNEQPLGGYYIPGYGVEAAASFLQSQKNNE